MLHLVLRAPELRGLIWQLKREPSEREFDAFMKHNVLNGSGKMTLEDYLGWLHGDGWCADGVPARALAQPHLLTLFLVCRIRERSIESVRTRGSTQTL